MVRSRVRFLVATCHPGPTLVVSALVALLSLSMGLPWERGALVTLAVFAGQLTIGWSNDLLDAGRDRSVGRGDKPLAQEGAPAGLVKGVLLAAGLVCVAASLACGWEPAALHLGLVVASGWAYNLGLKRTVLSLLPYLLAFGSLPHVVSLSDPSGSALAPWWMGLAGALLGAAAHLLNVLPDLAADEATDVRGFPHRIGEFWLRACAAATVALSFVIIAAQGGLGIPAGAALSVPVAGATAVTLRAGGTWPFRAVLAIALLDVALLVAAAPARGGA